MSGGVFDEIRSASERVARSAKRVAIDEAGLERLVDGLAADPPQKPDPDPAHHALADPEHTLAYVVTLDAINFGSGWFPVLAKRPGCSGYFTIANALKEHFVREGPWDAAALRATAPADCAALFGQDPHGPAAELMSHFARALRDLGSLLAERFGGSFGALVAAADARASALLGILAAMPLYQDVSSYEGRPVPFYKRAQITAADLHAAFGGEGPGRFDDLAELTIFADNLVPHVLRRAGVLCYARDLAARIDAEERLPPGSPEEVEIRACALHAVERAVAALRERGVATTAQALDTRLWNQGQRPEIKAHPRHRTRSVYY